MLTELDVVNACLATLGETPLVELSDDHPMVPSARQDLREAMVQEMGRVWWFNTDYCQLSGANKEGFVYTPADAISVKVIGRDDLTMRSRRLYDRYTSTYNIGPGPFQCIVVRELPFEDLPAQAQAVVRHATVLQFQLNYDADERKTAKLEALYGNAYTTLNAEHIRQIALNGLQTPEIMASRRNAGVRPRRGGHYPVR